MARPRKQLALGLQVPNFQNPIVRSRRGSTAVGADRNRLDEVFVTAQRADLLVSGVVPDGNVIVDTLAGSCEKPVVRGECKTAIERSYRAKRRQVLAAPSVEDAYAA